MNPMQKLEATVKNGRLTMDEPTDLPDGTVVELVAADDHAHLDTGDPLVGMSDEQRAQLHAELAQSERELDAGQGIPIGDALRDL